MEYRLVAHRVDSHGGLARAKAAEVVLRTDRAGRENAFDTLELLPAARVTCRIKGVEAVIRVVERMAPMLTFAFTPVEVRREVQRQDTPPKRVRISHEIILGRTEGDARLDLMHRKALSMWHGFHPFGGDSSVDGDPAAGVAGGITPRRGIR